MIPKISIITPTLNVEKNIKRCLMSVINQRYSNIEHYIIDGLSTDETVDIVKKYAKKFSHIKLISEKDDGIYDAMNKGITNASGEWIFFLGSDDIFFDDDVLCRIFMQNDDYKKFDFLYGNVAWSDTGNIYDGKFTSLKLIQKNICHQAVFVRKSIYEEYANFDVRYKVCADWDFNMKVFATDNVRKKYIDMTVAQYGINGFSASNRDLVFEGDMANIVQERFFYENKILKEKRYHIKRNEMLKAEILMLKSSKFWKLRNAYIYFKKEVKLLFFTPNKFMQKYLKYKS